MATKSGNTYLADVSHFSYWNCDHPFNDAANFSATFVDQNGQPLRNIHVTINFASGGYTGAHGMPDSSGYLNARVPAGQALVLAIHGNFQCQGPIFSQNIGPFAVNSNNNLGNITVNLSGPLLTTITGTAVNCSSTPVTNGYAEIHVGYHIYRANVINGAFSVSFLNCGSTQAITYFVVDNATNQQSSPVTATVTTGSNSVGSVSACGTSTLRFINFSADGTNYSLTSPPDSTTGFSFTQGTATTAISGNNLGNTASIYFNFSGQALGTFPMGYFHIKTPTLTDSMYVVNNAASVTVTEFGGPGIFHLQQQDQVSSSIAKIFCFSFGYLS
jgi:hypothetical protein